ncbi:hypothetical protein L2E82_00194 [Cichorium intybus]|uniref:Uncharacterized protein n=1 Tax=Cichorium intybus TaxID=13427 RepID=A0ACB9GX28_CICIN|nr:hypothetical protein L2E82_00194 [Cichorium intybus]
MSHIIKHITVKEPPNNFQAERRKLKAMANEPYNQEETRLEWNRLENFSQEKQDNENKKAGSINFNNILTGKCLAKVKAKIWMSVVAVALMIKTTTQLYLQLSTPCDFNSPIHTLLHGGCLSLVTGSECTFALSIKHKGRLDVVIRRPDALHPDNEMAYDNAVCALGKICQFHGDCINAAQIVPAWLNGLPLKGD